MQRRRVACIATVFVIILVCVALFALKGDPTPRISTVIAPHHNIVAHERAALFAEIAPRTQNRPIILLAPNHYDSGSATVQLRTQDFTTQYGTVRVNQALASAASDLGAIETPISFEIEHGVKTFLPDIATYYPDTTILPLIIKPDISQSAAEQLLRGLKKACHDCLVMASVDFSHYQPFLLSELHDDLSRRGLSAVDVELITEKAEIGEVQIARMALLWAHINQTERFVEYHHTNSTDIDKNYYIEGTTHFFGWYEAGAKTPAASEVSFTFVGDIFFDRAIRDRFHPEYQEAFSQLGDRVLWGTDLVMGNLEGPITQKETLPQQRDTPRFAFSPLARSALSYLHFSHLNIRNNHTLDTGPSGVVDTIQYLEEAGIAPSDDPRVPAIIDGHGRRIVVFSIDATRGDALTQLDFEPFDDEQSHVVVYVHWGPEYNAQPTNYQKQLAHHWIDIGADMVVGTGPHVIQPTEVYNNKAIIYSLGNFLFDMTGSNDTTHGLVLTGKFTNNALVLQPMLTTHQNLKPLLIRSKAGDNIISSYFDALKEYQTDDRGGVQFSLPW